MKEIIVYHGSDVSFDQFNIQKSKRINEHGFGLYFGLDKSKQLHAFKNNTPNKEVQKIAEEWCMSL